MGLNLLVYSEQPAQDESVLFCLRPWAREGDGWVCRTKRWQVVLNASERLTSEDAGDHLTSVQRVLPSVQWMTSIDLEGHLSQEAVLIATWTAHRIAVRRRGVFYDPSQDTITMPLSEFALSSIPEVGRASSQDT